MYKSETTRRDDSFASRRNAREAIRLSGNNRPETFTQYALFHILGNRIRFLSKYNIKKRLVFQIDIFFSDVDRKTTNNRYDFDDKVIIRIFGAFLDVTNYQNIDV